MSGSSNGIVQELTRAMDVASATVLARGRRAAGKTAAELSRRGRIAAKAQLCNEAVFTLISLVYEPDTDGTPCNADLDGRLIVPAPWGRAGFQYYGLRRTESEVLRRYMFQLMDEDRPLFTYDPTVRSWFVNVWDYQNMKAALDYWKGRRLSVKVYKALASEVSNS